MQNANQPQSSPKTPSLNRSESVREDQILANYHELREDKRRKQQPPLKRHQEIERQESQSEEEQNVGKLKPEATIASHCSQNRNQNQNQNQKGHSSAQLRLEEKQQQRQQQGNNNHHQDNLTDIEYIKQRLQEQQPLNPNPIFSSQIGANFRVNDLSSNVNNSSKSSNNNRQQMACLAKSLVVTLLVVVVALCANPSCQIHGQQVNANKLLSSRKLSGIQASSPLANAAAAAVASAAASSSLTNLTGSNIPGSNNGKLLVCYYTNWSQYRPKEGKYVPEDIDPNLCTHVIVAFGWMKKNRLAPFDASDESKDGKKGLYERVTSLKLVNPNLKVLIAVGGWSFGTERFKTMSANRYNRQLFIFSALEFLRERNFDGLDLDWEFPKGTDDKKNFVDLLKELREAFDAEAKEKRLPKLLLTAAVSAGSETVRGGYDVAPIGSYVDFINVMSYDFHGKWESKTGHNAPLFAPAGETEWRKQLSMDFGIKLWERMGAPKSKLVVGLATYGRSFTLSNPSQHGMNAPTSGGGKAGEFTRESGFLAFYEICDMLKQGATYYWDEEQAVPYAVHGDQWVGFDDELSIRNKVKWLNEQGYAGAMVWALDMDDFKGVCTPKKYPLIRAMAEGLFNLPARPSQEWRILIETARNRATLANQAASTGSSSIIKSPNGQTPSEVALAAAAAITAANNILNQAVINNPAAADAIRSAIVALGPSAMNAQSTSNGAATSLINSATSGINQSPTSALNGATSTSQLVGELAGQLKNIPGLNVTNLLSSPSAIAALQAVSPQLAAQLVAQNKSLDSTNARIVCYYTNWSHKRPGSGKFGPENLDPNLCTHIIYAFYGLKDSKLVPTEEIDNSDSDQAPYKRIIALKQLNPNLKVMLAVGGWMMGYAPFRQLTENAYRQTFFTFEVIEFLRKRNFDGLDLCWEFPRGLDDKEKFSNLVKELRESFDGEAKSSGKSRLLLSAAVPASFEAIAAGYDVPVINKYLDFMNVMTYDFHGDWEQVVGHNSPLFPLNSATAYQKKLTLDFSAAEWVRQGASKENLVIGLPTYGRTFTLANPNLTDIDAPAARGGRPGQYTKESGFLSFFEVCEMLKSQATLVWDNEQMIPYAYKGDQWVGFDDPRSFKMKVQWLKQNGYSGIMIWSVDMDDFAGSCMGLRYPLIKSAKEELKGYYVPNLVESAQGSSIHPSINLKDKDELQCEETDGHITYHKDKKDCTMYYMCEGSRKHHMPCPQNLVFNQNENVCDWPENVEGCGTKLPATASTS